MKPRPHLVEGKLEPPPRCGSFATKRLKIDAWVHDIVAALHVKYRWHLDWLATLQNTNGIALFHRLSVCQNSDVQE